MPHFNAIGKTLRRCRRAAQRRDYGKAGQAAMTLVVAAARRCDARTAGRGGRCAVGEVQYYYAMDFTAG
jgi:hypothetical protein